MLGWPKRSRDRSRRPVLFDDESKHLDRFGALLLLTYATIVSFALIDYESVVSSNTGNALQGLVANVLASATLWLAMRSAGLARRWRRVIDTFLAVQLGCHLVVFGLVHFASRPEARQLEQPGQSLIGLPWIALILTLLAFLMVLRRLLQHDQVTLATLWGAVAAYLLIPLTFAHAFQVVNGLGSEPFFGTRQPTTDFMNYSLAVVTTLGSSSLVPATNVAQILAETEAMVGQLFLVIFVAMIVGMMATRWRPGGPAGPGSSKPDGDDRREPDAASS